MDSNQLIVNTTKTYFNLSLNLSEANTSLYQKCIQLLYKTIKLIDNNVIIIKYKGEEEEIIE